MTFIRTITFPIVAVLLSTLSFATTCVWGRKFKVHYVCGRVQDADRVEIPNATVQVKRMGQDEIVAESKTSADGRFVLPAIANGDYEIRVKFAGFADASHSFQLEGSNKATNCMRPISVVMVPAGSCSYVENAWRDRKK